MYLSHFILKYNFYELFITHILHSFYTKVLHCNRYLLLKSDTNLLHSKEISFLQFFSNTYIEKWTFNALKQVKTVLEKN